MSSHAMTQVGTGSQLGGAAFNHSQSQDAEAEYDRLRGLAREEAGKRSSCFDKAHQAYERGDGAGAHELSEEGKKHAAKMDAYNKQASDYIFRENNAPGRVADDTIDLHGQFVNEAEEILEKRIRHAQQTGQSHLHVIVGKGNHSRDHVQKIKPKVEEICGELGLKFATEENAGRMYINLTGGEATMPDHDPYAANGGGKHHSGGQHQGQQPAVQQGGPYQGQDQQNNYQQGYSQPQQAQNNYQQGGYNQQQQQGGNNQDQNDEVEKMVKKFLPRIMRKMEGCCIVM